MCEKDCLFCDYGVGRHKREPYQYPCCECEDYSHFKEYIGENLYPMEQYPLERRAFEELFSEIEKRTFYEGINEVEDDEFRYWKYGDEFYILHKDSGTLINWYKHLGRCNTCNKPLSIAEYREFASRFLETLDYFGY